MTASLREAATMALEALAAVSGAGICEASHHKKADRHESYEACPLRGRSDAAIVALRVALAHPDAEPVAYKVGCLLTVNDDQYPALPGLFGQLWDGEVVAARVYGNSREEVNARVAALNVKPSAPVERKPLTDEEISMLWWNDQKHFDAMQLARAVEKHHGIKAAP